MFRPDPNSSTPIAVVSALTVFACMLLKFASTAYFLLSKNPSDIESTPCVEACSS